METFAETLRQIGREPTAFVGVGNVERGDDAFGVRLAECLRRAGVGNVFVTGRDIEHLVLGRTLDRFESVVFLDAANIGALPGSVALLDQAEMISRLPPVSTHRISLGLLARLVGAHCWLLAIQPLSLSGCSLTPATERMVATLALIIAMIFLEAPEPALTTPAPAPIRCFLESQ
jgi:hydrogenase maturation protease